MGSNPHGILLGLSATIASASAFMNNSAVTPIFIPPAIGVARRLKLSPSKFLMPVAFASLLGGTCTLIGTSTNVAASGLLQKLGYEPIGMFELTPVAVVVALLGVVYIATVGYWLLPERVPREIEEEYGLRQFLSEVVIVPDSPLAGKSLAESGLGTAMDLTVLAIHRKGDPPIVSPSADALLREGDLLVVQGRAQQIARVKGAPGIEMRADLHPSAADLTSDNVKLVEVMTLPNSDLLGRTLKEINFRRRYGVTAIGLYRDGEPLASKVGQIRLRLGDVLLVQGRKDAIALLSNLTELEVLEDVTHFIFNRTKSLLAIGLFAVAILVGSLRLMPLDFAILTAALLIVLSGCIPWRDAHKEVYWRLVVLIGGMTAFGIAMTKTGTDRFLAAVVVDSLGPWGTIPVLIGFFVITVILTQPMSNASAGLVVLPVAISAANALHVNPRTFAIAVTIAASCSFITPMEPSCLMVYGPGRYRFHDFIVCGAPLTLVVLIVTVFMVPWLWPLALVP
jgi:di/tricarboxylate transporter